MLIISDSHFGVSRNGGTTPASKAALKEYLLEKYRDLLRSTDEDHLVVQGDLFDDFECDPSDWMGVYALMLDWVTSKSYSNLRGKRCRLTLISGNHDNSMRGDKVSAFTMLATILGNTFPDNVEVLDIGQSKYVEPGVYAIPHCANQDLFDLELKKALEQEPEWLLLHCNLNNTFAQRSDHSLDLSEEWANKFEEVGTRILMAHEHQAREVRNVVVLGNQFSTSVSDCLGNDAKYAHTLVGGHLSKVETWSRGGDDGYLEIDWRDLRSEWEKLGVSVPAGFVRIVGNASSAEAAQVMNAIATFRKAAPATLFVVTNAVVVEGIAEVDELPEKFRAAEKFDVLDFIRKQFETDEMAVIETLLQD